MGDFLRGLGASIGYGADPNAGGSEAQLEQYRRMAAGNAKYDERAKAAGFNNGDEMIAYLRNQQNRSGGTTPTQGTFGRVREGAEDAAMMHPKNLFSYIGEALKRANGNDGY